MIWATDFVCFLILLYRQDFHDGKMFHKKKKHFSNNCLDISKDDQDLTVRPVDEAG